MHLNYKQRLATPIIMAADYLGFLNVYSFLRECLVGPQAVILVYHRVGDSHKYPWSLPPTRTQDFEDEIKYLCQKYEVVSLNTLITAFNERKALTVNTAVITFDDGYKDNYINAYPILKNYNVPATIFLTTGYIGMGSLFWWDKVKYVIHHTRLRELKLDRLGIHSLRSKADRLQAGSMIERKLWELPMEERDSLIEKIVSVSGVAIPANLGKELILSWEEVREMSENGIAFGAHTVTHPILTKLPLKEAQREIIESKRCIEEQLGQTVITFSYPSGQPTDFNDGIKGILKESGFICAVTGAPMRPVAPGMDVFELQRIPPGWNFHIFKFFLELYSDLQAISKRISIR